MLLDPKQCYQAIKSRDARFDGRFFFGVSSTGIYCRPVCSAKSPKFENCFFFPNAAAAEAANFRPCLRCRPELAPGNASIDATARLAQKAIRLVEDGFLDELNLSNLAEKLGITDRHLRRIFKMHFGVNPIKFAQTQRLLFANRLLADTCLPITDIAFSVGFKSISRFNSLFKERYGFTPTHYRQIAPLPQTEQPLVFELRYCQSFNWPLLLHFINHHSIPSVEKICNESGIYSRTVRLLLNGQWHIGWLSVEDESRLSLLRVSLDINLAKAIVPILKRIKSLFDLNCNPDQMEMSLGALLRFSPGIRVPGAFDGFEITIISILKQSIEHENLTDLSTLIQKFVSYFGDYQLTPFPELTHTFPTPNRIASASIEEISIFGINKEIAKTIIDLSKYIINKNLILDSEAELEGVLTWLNAFPQINKNVCQYILMRALSWPDAFPLSNLDAIRILKLNSDNALNEIKKTWSPWCSYASMYLWAEMQGEK